MNCLIIADIQKDFCPGGALPIAGGDQVIPIINKISAKFDKVVVTQDWHPQGHISFASSHDRRPFEVIPIDGEQNVLWPDHCVQGTCGAEFHKDLDLAGVDLIIRKGNNPHVDCYSSLVQNDKTTKTGLQYYLWGLGVKNIFICGLATDYCVYYSAMDAAALGFEVTIIIDACRDLNIPADSTANALKAMRKENIIFEKHEAIRAGNAA